MQRIVVLAVFLALAFAQSPQTGVLVPTTIASGQLVNGVLAPTTQAANYHVDLYQFWVPENTSAVNLTFTNTNSADCDYINLYIRGANSGGLPCSQDDYDAQEFPCAMDWSIYDGIPSTYYQLLDSSTEEDIYEWEVNSWLYIGVGRYGSYNTYTCTYSFTATINGSCQTGSIGVGDDDQTVCVPYTTINSAAKMNITGNGDNFQQVYKIDLPLDVGHVYIQINSTDTGFELAGKNYGAPYDSDYNCDQSGYSYYDENTTIYYMDYYCYTPRVGSFFMFLTNTDYAFNASISISYLQCPTGMGGYNCTYSSVPLNETNAQTFFVPNTNDGDEFAYVYVDIPANYTGPDYQVYGSSSQSGYLYIRYGGYPEDSSTYGYASSYQYSSLPSSFTLNNFDFIMPGRWYFGLECYSGTNGCNMTIQKNNSNVVVTTGSTTAYHQTTTGSSTHAITSGSTTGSSTYSITSGSTTRAVTSGRATTAGATTSQNLKSSSAVAVVPSFVAAIFAILALF
jgi:hypothetical protein